MGVSAAAACAHHPGREAIGVCVRCRTRVCGECATKLQGINYCVACLDEMAVAAPKASGGQASGGLRLALAALGHLGVLWLLMWGLLEVALPAGRWWP